MKKQSIKGAMGSGFKKQVTPPATISGRGALRSLDRLVKHHTRFARQNGAHVTPTFMVDGLIDLSIGSGDTVEQWIEKLGPI